MVVAPVWRLLANAMAAFPIAAVARLFRPLLLPVSVWTSMSLERFGDWSNKIDKIGHNLIVTDFFGQRIKSSVNQSELFRWIKHL